MNLLEDLHAILQEKLEDLEYKIDKSDKSDIRKILSGLINLQDKTISQKKRNVFISKELMDRKIETPYDEYLK